MGFRIWDFLFVNRKVFAILSVVSLFGCVQKTSFTEVKINDQYLVHLPSFLEKTTKLHKDASLQYENQEKEFYVVIIDERKKELKQYNLNFSLSSYFDSVKNQMNCNGLENAVISAGNEIKVDSCNAITSEITGKTGKENVFYKFAVIESNEHYYQLFVWTLNDYREKYSADMDSVIFSLRELRYIMKREAIFSITNLSIDNYPNKYNFFL